ncbi:MAG TPA: hypothetical protein VGW30_01420, partial [Gaiellaceae bacterium]|nr:hypothetical protein [Gaiellaceae bacterium]
MAAVGYLMLALAGVLLVAAVVLLRVSRGRKGDTPASAEHANSEPQAAPGAGPVTSLSTGFARAQNAQSV